MENFRECKINKIEELIEKCKSKKMFSHENYYFLKGVFYAMYKNTDSKDILEIITDLIK